MKFKCNTDKQWNTGGLNSIIQATKSKARGYCSYANYKNIVYLITGKLDFSLINGSYGKI